MEGIGGAICLKKKEELELNASQGFQDQTSLSISKAISLQGMIAFTFASNVFVATKSDSYKPKISTNNYFKFIINK